MLRTHTIWTCARACLCICCCQRVSHVCASVNWIFFKTRIITTPPEKANYIQKQELKTLIDRKKKEKENRMCRKGPCGRHVSTVFVCKIYVLNEWVHYRKKRRRRRRKVFQNVWQFATINFGWAFSMCCVVVNCWNFANISSARKKRYKQNTKNTFFRFSLIQWYFTL